MQHKTPHFQCALTVGKKPAKKSAELELTWIHSFFPDAMLPPSTLFQKWIHYTINEKVFFWTEAIVATAMKFYSKYILTIKLYFVIQVDKPRRQKILILHFKISGSTELQPFPFIS